MKYIAIVPWGEVYYKDQIFNLENKVLNRDNGLKIFVDVKSDLGKKGWELHTIDYYSDITKPDLIVFFCFDKIQYKRVMEKKIAHRTVYIAFEPPVVDTNHTVDGIRILLKYFHYVLTWNDAIVDNKRIFKFMLPYNFCIESEGMPFEEKKLLVNISGNKHSNQKYELYSEREKVISYFDGKPDFELYGTNWDINVHPSYKGLADRKADVYHQFKFALCLENMWNIDGYITEKILDCFCAGIIPIYLGAKNIDDYIPGNCYISYTQYDSLEKLEEYLRNMTKEEYRGYINNINKYLHSSKIQVFLPSTLSKSLVDLLNGDDERFRPDGNMLVINLYVLKMKIMNKIKGIKRKLFKTPPLENVQIGQYSSVDSCSSIGEYTYVGKSCLITRASIGRYVSIGNNVSIGPGEHRLDRISTSSFLYEHEVNWYLELTQREVTIGNDVWIGSDSIIRRGVSIGNGAVVGANSFVNKDVPDFAIVAGNPAKFIRYRFSQEVMEKIIDSKWWDYDLDEARRIVNTLENEG